MIEPWIQHPSGIRPRGLPDAWPPLDMDHGFTPPFAVDQFECGQSETVGVFPTISAAARLASRLHRRRWSGNWVEITDQRGTSL